MSQIWKKMKKSEMRKTFSGEKVFHFMLKSNCPKLRKTGTKSISTHWAKTLLSSCFFHVSPYVDFERNHRFGKKD